MSVQTGVLNFDGLPPDRNQLGGLSRSATRYGPDGESIYIDESVAMLYRPFHTTPESRFERQPERLSDGSVLTWDGRLDNREDLTTVLHLQVGDSPTDVDIVKASLERWGVDCLGKIIGDWALVIWNPREKELLLARDYMGIRSLFYRPTSRQVIWSTDLASLVGTGGPLTLSEEYLAGYLITWPDAHLTPYREIHAVPPGHLVCIRDGIVSLRHHWAFNSSFTTYYRTDAEYEERFRVLFRQAVRRRLRCESSVLAELSGGLDSSSIVCMADDLLVREGLQAPPVETFSFCDRGEPDEDDFLYFTKIEEHRGRIGHHAEVSGVGDSFSFRYEEFVPVPGFGIRTEIQTAKQRIVEEGKYKTVLSGVGGDEFLGGALDPRVQMADLLVKGSFRELGKQLLAWSLSTRYPLALFFAETVALLLPTFVRTRLQRDAQLESWVDRTFAKKHRLGNGMLAAAEGSWKWLPTRRDWLQTISSLGRQMTYAGPANVETRYPYLDRDLVEFLVSIPTEQLLRPGQRRSLMRRALADLLPSDVLLRTTKASTGRCFTQTAAKHWKELEGILSTLTIARLGYINPAEFQTALEGVKNGCISPFVLQIFRALSLELWLKEMLFRGVLTGSSDCLGSRTAKPLKLEAQTNVLRKIEI